MFLSGIHKVKIWIMNIKLDELVKSQNRDKSIK